MGFFAIAPARDDDQFDIEACHLTFWVLPQYWYRLIPVGFRYFFDIGLRIHAITEIRRIRIALPFDTGRKSLSDLSAFVLNPSFAPLIFGRPVTVTNNRIGYDAQTLGQGPISDIVIPIDIGGSTPDQESHPIFSAWTIELQNPIAAGQFAYVRFRFRVKKPGALWAEKGWGYAKRGMIVDLRVSDVREFNVLGFGNEFAARLKSIKHLFLFLGTPAYFVPKHISPPLQYSRLLEPLVWRPYLDAPPLLPAFLESRIATPISIHQWRSKGAGGESPTHVDLDRPYRAYMDVSREFGRALWLYYIAVTASLPIASAIWGWIWSALLKTWFFQTLQRFVEWLSGPIS